VTLFNTLRKFPYLSVARRRIFLFSPSFFEDERFPINEEPSLTYGQKLKSHGPRERYNLLIPRLNLILCFSLFFRLDHR